ncbi:oxidoreductase, short chain dehydrogenase/reductase domain protein [Burkholderia cenocepacia BC7]|uniref:short-chain dehydrogenase/reductase n=1 Tax=Burkholderia cenocepacia TaxID=95486 RepID=UPI0003963BC4|nr:short-chain dehydrogenase/reductase [Burkholderia cenocepacia]ERI26234.1 oxidoreductase, short chain dehydrogenase/reductase domain protein [Burkholderia cenocepacia BC7]
MNARAAHVARIALITGAGSGIGAALARRLAAPGVALALRRSRGCRTMRSASPRTAARRGGPSTCVSKR